jgi:hypothetical protein
MKRKRIYLYPIGKFDRTWSPFTLGTYDDLKALGLIPEEGMKLEFYTDDGDGEGNRDDLLFEGTAHFVVGRGWGAIIDASTFHWESDVRRSRNPPARS